MSNKIFKNYQVNMGMPIKIRPPVNFHTLQQSESLEDAESGIEQDDEGNGYGQGRENYEDKISKAREEADLLIQEARLEALRMLENAERELLETRIAVEEEARLKGYEEGYNEAKKQYEDLIQEAEFIREHAKTEYREVLEGIEADAVNVILDIAKKVIGTHISINKDDMLQLVRQAFEKCSNKERVILKVAAEDYDLLVENRDKLLSMVEGINDLEIKKDGSLKTGDCIVETDYGSVDAGISTKLQKIEESFRSVIGK